jgi:hypothetical protein
MKEESAVMPRFLLLEAAILTVIVGTRAVLASADTMDGVLRREP